MTFQLTKVSEITSTYIHSAAKQIHCPEVGSSKGPKSLLISLSCTNFWAIYLLSSLLSLSFWIWHTVTPMSLFWRMVDLRNLLKLCSAWADDMGTTNNLTSVSTWSNRPWTSGTISFKVYTASAVVLILYLFLNVANWTFKFSWFGSAYLWTASFIMPVRSVFSNCFIISLPCYIDHRFPALVLENPLPCTF